MRFKGLTGYLAEIFEEFICERQKGKGCGEGDGGQLGIVGSPS